MILTCVADRLRQSCSAACQLADVLVTSSRQESPNFHHPPPPHGSDTAGSHRQGKAPLAATSGTNDNSHRRHTAQILPAATDRVKRLLRGPEESTVTVPTTTQSPQCETRAIYGACFREFKNVTQKLHFLYRLSPRLKLSRLSFQNTETK